MINIDLKENMQKKQKEKKKAIVFTDTQQTYKLNAVGFNTRSTSRSV